MRLQLAVGLLIATSLNQCRALDDLSADLGLAEPVQAYSQQPLVLPADAQPYGLNGSLDEQQLIRLSNLAWPQSYEAIKDAFGFPAYRSSTTDFYKLSDGRFVGIVYDAGNQAISYDFSQD